MSSDPLDVVIVGAGSAGLSAALVLGRSRRRVVVLDGGPPRNAPAHAAYGLFTRDGTPPLDLLRIARDDLARYPSVEVVGARATNVGGTDGAFELALDGGDGLRARKVVLSTGVADDLPDVPGVAELWGGAVFHCPYCHGWEVRDRPLAVWVPAPHAAEAAVLLRGWSEDVIVLTDGPSEIATEDAATLAALGVPVHEGHVEALEHDGSALRAVRFADGSRLARHAVMLGVSQHERSGLPAALGCATTETGHVAAEPHGETSVPGVYAVGDVVSPIQSVVLAAARGAAAAYMLNRALAHDDARLALAA